jgi:hypothetical protein
MSEAAKHSRMIWEQYIEPALSDLLGSADFPSTPQGFNWYHGLFALGQDTSMPDYKSYTFPTWTNPVRYPGGIKNLELVRIRATVSKAYWEQEYGAAFTSMQGAIYEEWDERLHVHPHVFRPDWPNYAVFDFGFANPFVMLDVQLSPSEDVFVWREYYQRYISTYDHGMYLRDERNDPTGYHIDGMWGDPRGADEIATLSNILGFVASQDVPWKHGVEAIKRLLTVQSDGFPKLFVDPSCTNLIRQMGQLHVKESSKQQKTELNENQGDGNIQHKVDDHAADALRYFVGPYFVLGAGQHLEDIYGDEYEGSESESFFKLHNSATMTGLSGYEDMFD